MRALVWLRADLRVRDNTALHHACRDSDRGVVAVFLLSTQEWADHDWAAVKVDFVLRTLRELSASLARLNIPLLIVPAPRKAEIPAILDRLCREHACDALYCNREYEVNESRRDDRVRATLADAGVGFRAFDDQCILPPGVVRTGAGGFFTVFTPFKKAFYRALAERGGAGALPMPKKQAEMPAAPSAVPERVEGFVSAVDPGLWPAGEKQAEQRLARFCRERISAYKERRDFPAEEATSRLSPYLTVGAVSPRACLAAALDANSGRLDSGDPGAAHYISELVWREFYRHLLVGFPRVCMGRAFKPATDRVRWAENPAHLAAWAEGRTGYPIVDAAMRQLRETGWMHNRLRMVAAMFLTKDLFLDWRLGERHFMRHLIDGDLANNNGGWQWSAGTGADAAPYFRVFNPTSQSRKFDPSGAFIRRYVPELADLDDEDIHDPAALPMLLRLRIDYPSPIVDHAAARERVIAAFRAVGETRAPNAED